MPEFTNFCQEELPYYGYLSGNKQSPVPIAMDPFVHTPIKPAVTPPSTSRGEHSRYRCATKAYVFPPTPHLQEFRIAYLLYRRELTSAELIELQNPSASIPSAATIAPPPLATSGIVPSTPSIPKPIFASTTPSLPKFTFGFK